MERSWKEVGRRIAAPMAKVAALVLLGLVYFLGIRSERTGFVREVLDPGFNKLSRPVLNVFRAGPPPVAEFTLIVDSASWDSLQVLHGSVLQRRRVDKASSTFFAGRIRIDEREVPVVVGLLEGATVEGRKRSWPLQVRLLPGDSVLGMRSFDVLPVVDEAPLWSYLLQAILHDQGHATVGQALAEVHLNALDQGLCMIQGSTDAHMIARWSRGSGPVLRFDDAMLRDARAAMAERSFPSTPPPQGDWLSAPLMLGSAAGVLAGKRAQRAIARMGAFRSGELTASEVFDVDHLARALALCDLLGTQEAMDWWNLRFLVDSLSEDIVPIPLHLSARAPIGTILAVDLSGSGQPSVPGRELAARVFEDTLIQRRYLAYLDTFSAPGWWEATRERTRPQWEPARKAVNAEFPRIDLDLSVVEHDRTVIRQTLAPTELVLAYMRDAQDPGDGIAITNVHALPVDVYGVLWSTGDTLLLSPPMRLAPRHTDRPLSYRVLPIAPIRHQGVPTEVLVRVGALGHRRVRIRSWSTFEAN